VCVCVCVCDRQEVAVLVNTLCIPVHQWLNIVTEFKFYKSFTILQMLCGFTKGPVAFKMAVTVHHWVP
jgi:hypothetical protein